MRPEFAPTRPERVPMLTGFWKVCVPPHVLSVLVPKASEMASVTRESGYEKVSGFSYVPKSETCDLVMERLPSVVMLATEEGAARLLSKSGPKGGG